MEKEQQFVEEATIGNTNIRLIHAEVPLAQIELDEDNPRIRYRVSRQVGKPHDEVILGLPEVKGLFRDIKQNGGLRERGIVQPNGHGGYKGVEGNCRPVIYRKLHKENPTDAKRKTLT